MDHSKQSAFQVNGAPFSNKLIADPPGEAEREGFIFKGVFQPSGADIGFPGLDG